MKKIACIILMSVASWTGHVFAFQNVTPSDVDRRLENNDEIVIVDVREPGEYQLEHIPGAVNMPWNSGILQARSAELPTNRDVIVVCRSGNRSVSAGLFLDSRGFAPVFNMLGGMMAWEWDVAVPGSGMHHYGPGWIHRDSDDTTYIHCPTDSMDWLEFPPGCMMGMMYPDSIYCDFEEIEPDSIPCPHDSTIVGGYHVHVRNPMGHGMMNGGHMGFPAGVALHLHYGEEMAHGMYEDSMMVQCWEEADSQWVRAAGAVHDPQQNTLILAQGSIKSYYGLFSSPVSANRGDLNADGELDVIDAIFIVRMILGFESPTLAQSWAADVNGDSQVNVLDVLRLVKIILDTP